MATIEVKSNLNASELKETLENCYSVGHLTLALSGPIEKIAKKRGLKPYKTGFVHTSPIETARGECFSRPSSYIIGIKGYSSHYKKLKTAIYKWGSRIIDNMRPLALKHFPSVIITDVIITEGCYAWRNDHPLSVPENYYLLGGRDENPLRLLILHLLYTLYNRIPSTADREGMKPELSVYLNQIRPPEIKWKLFSAANPVDAKTEEHNSSENRDR